jgi:hypothetical protein
MNFLFMKAPKLEVVSSPTTRHLTLTDISYISKGRERKITILSAAVAAIIYRTANHIGHFSRAQRDNEPSSSQTRASCSVITQK